MDVLIQTFHRPAAHAPFVIIPALQDAGSCKPAYRHLNVTPALRQAQDRPDGARAGVHLDLALQALVSRKSKMDPGFTRAILGARPSGRLRRSGALLRASFAGMTAQYP